MAGIVNKVCLLPVLSRVNGVGVVGCGVCWDPGFLVARKARNFNASDKQ